MSTRRMHCLRGITAATGAVPAGVLAVLAVAGVPTWAAALLFAGIAATGAAVIIADGSLDRQRRTPPPTRPVAPFITGPRDASGWPLDRHHPSRAVKPATRREITRDGSTLAIPPEWVTRTERDPR